MNAQILKGQQTETSQFFMDIIEDKRLHFLSFCHILGTQETFQNIWQQVSLDVVKVVNNQLHQFSSCRVLIMSQNSLS